MTMDMHSAWRRASHSHAGNASGSPIRIAVTTEGERPTIGFRQERTTDRAPQPVLLEPDAHVMSFAPTGAGKMVSCVAPALLQHEGPAIVLDPKGEIAAVTARRRREMGQAVHVIDPFEVSGLAASTFNPLDIIEPGAPDSVDEASVLARSLMPAMTAPRDAFWYGRAVHMLTAAALSAVSDHPPERRNLTKVRDIMHDLARGANRSEGRSGRVIRSRNPDVARINDLMDLGATETVGGIVHTALEGVGFIQGPLVERSLKTSSFRIDDITEGVPMTIYLVLPPHMLISHGVMLRLWLNTLFSALMRRRTGPAVPTLLLLDEAAQLGHFPPLETAITLLRGYGVQTWSLWQDVTQLAQHYPRGYRTMLNNCRVIQVFGTGSEAAWRQSGEMLGIEVDRRSFAGEDRMLLVLDGEPMPASRIDYRDDPELAPHADPNPFHAPPAYPLRRRRPRPGFVPGCPEAGTKSPHAMAEISAALGRL